MSATAKTLMSDGVVDLLEAQRLTALSRSYLYLLMDRGDLRYTKVGKRRLISRTSLVKLLADGLVTAGERD
jgi:excisionase family DNA binding protein